MIRFWRKATAYTGLVLLAINLITGALLPARAAQTDGPSYICTALGLKAIGPDSGESGQTGQGSAFCAACLPLMQGGLDAPPSAPAIKSRLAAVTPASPPAAVLVPPLSSHHAPQSPRAPPAV